MQKTLYLGQIWHVLDAGKTNGQQADLQSFIEGALCVSGDGKILAMGESTAIRKDHADAVVVDCRGKLIIPGFIDTHLHFPQMDIIGSYGEDLLGWLRTYTFPVEESFRDADLAAATAKRFFHELLANGTTLSAVYSSPHLAATEKLFQAAKGARVKSIIGKTSMDRNAPDSLLTDATRDRDEVKQLISQWHGHDGRLHYALTPRFAPTASEALLRSHGTLLQDHRDLYLQTHYAENEKEIAWVKELFPASRHYLDVYDHFGLLGERTILAHGIHVSNAEADRLSETRSKISHCPTSNLFLGSGFFPQQLLLSSGVNFGLGTDVGAGTSFSMWRTMGTAYKVQRLKTGNSSFSPIELFYAATLGGALTLNQDQQTGNFEAGKDADFQIVDWQQNRLLKHRFETVESPAQRLFAMMFLADDRVTHQVYIRGEKVYQCA